MSQTFEQRSGAETHDHTEHNGIDFRLRRMQMLGLTNMEQILELWWQHDDGSEQQLTPDTLLVHMSNLSNDPMDRIMAYDKSTERWIVWWRQEHENFDDIAKQAMTHGRTTITPDPDPEVVKMFIAQHEVDLTGLEGVVADWSQGVDSDGDA